MINLYGETVEGTPKSFGADVACGLFNEGGDSGAIVETIRHDVRASDLVEALEGAREYAVKARDEADRVQPSLGGGAPANLPLFRAMERRSIRAARLVSDLSDELAKLAAPATSDTIETLVNGEEVVVVDLGTVWGETFVRWDALVPEDVAAEIATATEQILRKASSR